MEGSRIVSLWFENGRLQFVRLDVVGVGVGILDSTIWMERAFFLLVNMSPMCIYAVFVSKMIGMCTFFFGRRRHIESKMRIEGTWM